MGLKVYVSGMSGNKEVKKRQQRVLMILDSKNIKYDLVDITEPGKESEKEMMQVKSTGNGGTVSDPEPRHPLPPQLFNEEEYCGDYDAFDLANEIDTLEQFLKLVPADTTSVSTAQIELKQQDNADAKKTEEGDENKENETEQKEGEEEKKGDEEKTADEKEGDEKATAADGDDDAAAKTEQEEAVTAAVTAAAPTVATKSANIVEDAAVQQPTTVLDRNGVAAQTVTEHLIQNEKIAAAN